VKHIQATARLQLLFTIGTIISNSPLKGDDKDRTREEKVQLGFSISPVKLNLNTKILSWSA
jgi:hypothetical protein